MKFDSCSCGRQSIAQMAEHICEDCEGLYKLCIECQPDYPFKKENEDD